MTTSTTSDDAAKSGQTSSAKKRPRSLQTSVRVTIVLVVCCAAIFWACRMVWESYYPMRGVTRRLGSWDSAQRVTAIRDLTELGAGSSGEAIGVLIPLLKDPVASVRAEAAGALGVVGSYAVRSHAEEAGAATRTLLESLKDPATSVKVAATGALRILVGSMPSISRQGSTNASKGASSPPTTIDTKAVVAAFRGLLDDQDGQVRQAALLGLATIGPPVLGEPPEALFATVESDLETDRTGAIAALSSFPRGLDRLIPMLLRHLERDEPQVRESCAHALGRIQSSALTSAVVPDLVNGLGSRDRNVRTHIITLLGGIHPDAPSVVPALIKVLREPIDSDGRTMGNGGSISYTGPAHDAARALSAIAPGTSMTEVSITALSEVVQSGPDQRRGSAADALGRFGPSAVRAVPALIAMLEKAGKSEVRNSDGRSAARALGQIAPGTPAAASASAALTAALTAKAISTREAAIEELPRFGSGATAALPLLVDLKEKDPIPAVRQAAAAAIDALKDSSK
jgi:HEAT repeat protein